MMSDDTTNDEKQAPEKADAAPVDAVASAVAKTQPKPASTPKVEEKVEPSAAEMLAPDVPDRDAAAKKRRGKSGKNIPVGIVYIKSTFNNTLVTITDLNGNVVSWSSGGRCGFKGSRKSTAFSASTVSQDAARQASSQGMREVQVRVQGPGAGRESAIRALQSSGLNVTAIMDVTPIPHNGCRPPKRRRV